MRFRLILSILGFILIIVGVLQACVLPISFIYGGTDAPAIGISALITIIAGSITWLLNRTATRDLRIREGFAIVTFGWTVVSLFGSLPFILSGAIPSFTDAYFETISGFTTTGASILTDIESVPHGILFWRSLTQWIGGLGIILLSIAILPLLGIGGMQLFRAEVPGITVEKLTPRISQTARILWLVYVLLTVAQTLLLYLGGMSLYDAICHSLTTVSTGGFSTKNTSIAHFQSAYIEMVVIVFMVLAGSSFALHFRALRGDYKGYVRDNEFVFFIFLVVFIPFLIFLGIPSNLSDSIMTGVRAAVFQTISIITTTGFVTANYGLWLPAAQLILLILMFTGACTGSTAGGIKLVRILILLKNSINQMKALIHPKAVILVRHNGKRVEQNIILDVLSFFILFFLLFLFATIMMTMLGLDVATAAGSVASAMGNIGPAFGTTGPIHNYAHIPVLGKWILMFCMLAGRLELFTVLLLFTPAFWKR